MKNKANLTNAKSLKTASLGYFIAKSTIKFLLTFIKVEKIKRENFSFVQLLSFFKKHNLKTTRCMRILYIPNDCSFTGQVLFSVWDGVRPMTSKLWP